MDIKLKVLIAASMLATQPVLAVTCNTVGNRIYCDNGVSYSQVGNTLYGSDGSRTMVSRNAGIDLNPINYSGAHPDSNPYDAGFEGVRQGMQLQEAYDQRARQQDYDRRQQGNAEKSLAAQESQRQAIIQQNYDCALLAGFSLTATCK